MPTITGVDLGQLAEQLGGLRAKVAELEERLEAGRAGEGELASYRTASGWVVLLPRNLDGTGRERLEALTDEWDRLETEVRELRRKQKAIGMRLHEHRNRARAAGGLDVEQEERRQWKELEPEFDALTPEIEAAERRIDTILDTLRREFVALPVAASPFQRPAPIQE